MVMIPNAPRMGDMKTNDPVPEGVYLLRSNCRELKVVGPGKKSAGSPMAVVEFTIFGPAEAEEFHGRKIFENFLMQGDGTFRLRAFLKATGHDEDFVLEDTDQLNELECAGVVKVEAAQKDPETGKEYDAKNTITRFMAIE